MQTLQSHRVLIFCPDILTIHPQPLVHGLKNGLRLLGVGLRVFTKYLSNTGSEFVASIIIGRAMGDGTAIII